MRKIIMILTIIGMLGCMQPSRVMAVEPNWQIHAGSRDNSLYGELWYNDKPIWRIIVLSDGAKPVLAGNDSTYTFIVPEIINGWFEFKIQ